MTDKTLKRQLAAGTTFPTPIKTFIEDTTQQLPPCTPSRYSLVVSYLISQPAMVTHILRRNGDGPTSDSRSQRFAILVAAFAAVGGFLYGYDTGTISGILAMTSFKNTFGTVAAGQSVATLSTSETSLMVSILSAGTFFGALSGAPLADILGR